MANDASIYGSSGIACGGKAEKRARVAANSCSTLLKSYLSRRCQDNATEVDLYPVYTIPRNHATTLYLSQHGLVITGVNTNITVRIKAC